MSDDMDALTARLRDAVVDVPNYGLSLRMSLDPQDVQAAADTIHALRASYKSCGALLLSVQNDCIKYASRAERLSVLLAAVTEIAARNEDAECIREARRALEDKP